MGSRPTGKALQTHGQRLLLRAVHSGPPVARVGATIPRALYHCDNLSFIGGSNLTATKARLLLMACLMKFGALSPAAKTDQPTAGETAAVQSDIPSTASCQNARRVRF